MTHHFPLFSLSLSLSLRLSVSLMLMLVTCNVLFVIKSSDIVCFLYLTYARLELHSWNQNLPIKHKITSHSITEWIRRSRIMKVIKISFNEPFQLVFLKVANDFVIWNSQFDTSSAPSCYNGNTPEGTVSAAFLQWIPRVVCHRGVGTTEENIRPSVEPIRPW